jgi:pyridoxine/pyridoxamine 5'-phosphate oxidase
MSHVDTFAVAARLVAANRCMTIATVGPDGRPWVSPVWYAPASDTDLLWVSDPTSRHSRNIAARPQVAIVIFDSTVPEGAAEALYLEGTAQQLVGDLLEEAITTFSARSQACGDRAWTAADVLPPARFRLYRATAASRSVLGPGDQRLPLNASTATTLDTEDSR